MPSFFLAWVHRSEVQYDSLPMKKKKLKNFEANTGTASTRWSVAVVQYCTNKACGVAKRFMSGQEMIEIMTHDTDVHDRNVNVSQAVENLWAFALPTDEPQSEKDTRSFRLFLSKHFQFGCYWRKCEVSRLVVVFTLADLTLVTIIQEKNYRRMKFIVERLIHTRSVEPQHRHRSVWPQA